MPKPGWKIDTTSAILIKAMICEGDTISRLVGHGRPGIPLGGGGSDSLISHLAIGQTLTDHDVPLFGDFTWYVSTVVNTPLRDGQHTGVTLTPGMRTHLGRDWYFLAGLPTPVTSQRIGDLGMIFWFMKAW